MTNLLNCYVDSIIENYDKTRLPNNFNIIIDGGAFNGAFSSGCLYYIKRLEEANIINIDKISGCSIGAILGFLFFTNKLDLIPQIYDIMINCIRYNINLKYIHNLIKKIVSKDDYKKVNNRLFITYHNIKTLEHKVIYKYKSNNDLIEYLIKSSYIPLFTDGNFEYKNKYCDGLSPFIFNRSNNHTIFISLISISYIKYTIYTNYDKNIWKKFFDGLHDIHIFFKNDMKKTKYCSLVNNWTLKEFILFSIRELIFIILIIVIKYRKYLLLPNIIKNNFLLKRICKIISLTIQKILSYNIL